jgi:protein SCO1
MQFFNISGVTSCFDMNIGSTRKIFGMFAMGLLIGSGLAVFNAGAAEQPTQSMHDMSDMKDMEDMPGMERMDHSMHQQFVSKRGAYTSSVMTYQIPDVKMVDANGKSIPLRDLMDDHSAIMMNFIFTTCTTICPVMTSIFQQVQDKLGTNRNDVRMVSISINPENDTPANLQKYAAKYKAGAQWTFVTGTLDNSLLVQNAFGVLAGEKMNHRPVTFLKAKGSDTQWLRLEGLAEADQIVAEYKKLGMEQMKHE